jgi:hypothetical protein
MLPPGNRNWQLISPHKERTLPIKNILTLEKYYIKLYTSASSLGARSKERQETKNPEKRHRNLKFKIEMRKLRLNFTN